METVERLVVAVDGRNDQSGLNAERAVRQLDTRISDAIMHAMENGPALEEKVSTRQKNSNTRVIFISYVGWISSLAVYSSILAVSRFYRVSPSRINTNLVLNREYGSD